MRHFPHHIGDYAAATAHLSFVEDAAYHRLLRRYYQEEKPLPADIATVCRLVGARTKDERAAVEAVISEFFYLDGDQWRQKRADREIEAYQGKAEAARNNGRKGGRPANPRQTGSVPDRNPQETQSVSRGIPSEKLTNNQEPITKNQECVAKTESGAVGRAAREPVSRATLITDEWKPPDAEVRAMRAAMPWMDDGMYERRMQDFRDWCEANATRTFSPAATWRGFMRKTKSPVGEAGETFEQRRIRLCMEAIK